MASIYTCECQDGRSFTGNAKWTPEELRQMQPLQLVEVLKELREFAAYYSTTYYFPIQALEEARDRQQSKFDKAKLFAIIGGITTGLFTLLWLLLALIPALRFTGLTLVLAVLTFFSIILYIPIFFHFISAQEDYAKRYPRTEAKLRRLVQKQEQDIFGNHIDMLISGYLVSPEFSLSEEAMDYMIRALSSRNAANIPEAALLCRKQFGHSPVKRIITSLRSVGTPAGQKRPAPGGTYQKVDLTQMQSQGPDLRAVLQLSDYLHAALRSYAAEQKAANDTPDSIASTLTMEEEALVAEYRSLAPEEKKRIRRVVHSFYKKQY